MSNSKLFSVLLAAHESTDPLEHRRLSYVIWVELGLLVMFCGLATIHFIFGMHAIHYVGDIGGLVAVGTALFIFKKGNECLSGAIIIWSLAAIIFVYSVLVDYLAKGQVEFLRLYVTTFAMIGVFLLSISVFKTFARFVRIAILFSVITILHAVTIVYHNGGWPYVTGEMWSYFFVAILTINVAGFVTHVTSLFNKELMSQNKANLAVIHQHNINLNQIVERQTAELTESNERLRSFAHIASHDLKEPLRSISGFVSLIRRHLQKNYPEDKALNEYMDFANKGTLKMGELINDILSFSKLNTGKSDFEMVDLNETMDQVIAQLDTIITSSNTLIKYKDLPKVKGRPNLLLQVFLNLISNAIRYASPERTPVIELASVRTKDVVRISIKDNGIGIAAPLMSYIFMPYYSRTKSQSDDNTGMGLAICKKIVEFHGGRIWVESIENSGSQFYCEFPIA